jgi:UbiA prenyltransferase family
MALTLSSLWWVSMQLGLEIKSFLSHLRLHYQFLILSGAFLSGAVLSPRLNWLHFSWQFLNVHILLFGAVTVYNSYWDKDQGPIGGLRHPKPLASWTLPAAWCLQILGLGFAIWNSITSGIVFAGSMLFFWCYSRPGIRWKGRPLLSLIAIGASTGLGGFLLGYWHFETIPLSMPILLGALGVTGLIVSLFPMSQIYQVEEDSQRLDQTFVARYGLAGMRFIYATLFPLGIVMLSVGFSQIDIRLGVSFTVIGVLAGLVVWHVIRDLKMSLQEYERVMGVKYLASGLFVIYLIGILVARAFFKL